jgi:plastocyanin
VSGIGRRGRGLWPRRVLVPLWATAVAAAGVAGVAVLRASAAAPVTHTVSIDATRYEPARLVVHAGDTVVWVNKDVIPHTATARGGAFDSKVLAAGASWRLTAGAAGEIDYACAFHDTMTGRLVVEPAGRPLRPD